MATIDTKEQFGQAYTDLLSSHNYRGLVDLLSNTTFNTAESRYKAKKLIEQFSEQADIDDKLLEGADDKQKEAYNFVISGPSNIDSDKEGTFSNRFMNAWKSLADDNNVISFSFNSEEVYNKFINAFGNKTNLENEGISLGSDYSVSFPADIQNKLKIYNAVANSGYIEYAGSINKANAEAMGYTVVSDSDNPAGLLLVDKYGNMFSSGESGAITKSLEERSTNTAIKTKNKAATFRMMRDVVEEANNYYEEMLETKTTPYLNEMVVSGYMGEDDKQLQQALANGMIELKVFKEMRSILEEKYNRVLQTKSLSQYDVWAMDEDNEGSQVLQKLDDPMLKNQLDLEINEAIADNRLHFSHASNGIDIGTMLVIDPAKDNKGNIIGDSKPRRIFVKDLFRSQAENALRDDTQTDAQMQYAKHQTFKHTYRGVNGFTITDWDQVSNSAVYTNLNGIKKVVGKAEALDIIDDDIIAKRMIDYYENANKVDKNGKGYTQEYYRIYGNRGFNSSDLYNDISAKCLAAASSKYRGQSEQYIKYKAQELVSSILKGLGLDFESEINDDNGVAAISSFFGNRGISFE